MEYKAFHLQVTITNLVQGSSRPLFWGADGSPQPLLSVVGDKLVSQCTRISLRGHCGSLRMEEEVKLPVWRGGADGEDRWKPEADNETCCREIGMENIVQNG